MLLGQFKAFHSHNLDDIEHFVRTVAAGEVSDAELIAGGQGFRCNAATSDKFSIFSLLSDVSATFDFSAVDYHRFVFQTRRRSRIEIPRSAFYVTPSDAGYVLPVSSPAREMHPDGYRSLAVRIDPVSLRRRLAALCGNDIPGTIEFEQPQRKDARFIEFIRRPLFAAARELDIVGPRFQSHLMADLEAATLTRILLFATHNHSGLLDVKEAAPSRAQMGRAEDFIALNWNKPIDIEGIAEASGVSARTVLRYFQEKHGETPGSYVRKMRLDNARQMLIAVEEESSVVGIALKCGFSSLGHFAESYRRRFGELPSATLRGRKQGP